MATLPKVEQVGDIRIVTFTGARIRHNEVENILDTELCTSTSARADGHLLLDFTRVETISSLELATLINLQKRIHAAGGRLTLFNLSPHVFEVFSITHLDKFLSICRENHVTH